MNNSTPRPPLTSNQDLQANKQLNPHTSSTLPKRATNPPYETLYFDSDAYFDSMLLAIQQAKRQIELEVYIYESGALGLRFVEALTAAASTGVDVRVMVDGAGIDDSFTSTARTLTNKGVQLRIYRPLPWRFSHWRFSRARSQGLTKFWRLLSDINRRNHRKMLIVDRHQLWLGSMNISQAHLSKPRGGQGWRDTAVSINHHNLKLPIEAFDIAWNRARRRLRIKRTQAFQRSPFLFNFTRRLRVGHRQALLDKIEHAQATIWITNAYFVPDNSLLKALERAALRKVDVRILLPQLSDVFFMPWVSSIFYSRLINAGVKVFEYQPSILHAKTLVIDAWALVGSSNLNRRSLIHDLELDYCLQQQASIRQLKTQFEADLEVAEELDHSTLSKNKRWQRWLGALFLILLARWL